MKTFLIEFDYKKCHFECYVQKLKSKTEDVYILNFKDTFLIRQFNGKKMVFSSKNRNAASNDIFQENVWEAIMKKEVGG